MTSTEQRLQEIETDLERQAERAGLDLTGADLSSPVHRVALARQVYRRRYRPGTTLRPVPALAGDPDLPGGFGLRSSSSA